MSKRLPCTTPQYICTTRYASKIPSLLTWQRPNQPVISHQVPGARPAWIHSCTSSRHVQCCCSTAVSTVCFSPIDPVGDTGRHRRTSQNTTILTAVMPMTSAALDCSTIADSFGMPYALIPLDEHSGIQHSGQQVAELYMDLDETWLRAATSHNTQQPCAACREDGFPAE